MNADLLSTVRASGLLERGDALVVLVSGGADSVCLLDVAVELCGPEELIALHVNYGLRGENADGDERHVRELCAQLGVALVVERAGPAPQQGNVQAWARELRYGVARSLALARGAPRVAAGHTADDQAETILYRLAASPGRRALLGMSPQEGGVVRPLLGVGGEQIRRHCEVRGLSWREDATNASRTYARARVRHELLPALREVHPAARENVVRSAELLRAEAAVLDELVGTALGGGERIALARLRELPAALARLVVVRLAEDAAGAPVAGAGARVDELLALGRGGGSAQLDLGGGARAVVEYGVLRVAVGAEVDVPEPVSLELPGRARLGAWEVEVEPVDARAQPAPAGAAPVGLLDARALGARVTVRCWREGDRMAPLGLRGSKSVADLFGERRVPRAERRTLPLLEAEGAIAWIPGVATGERFRVTDPAAPAVRVRAERVAPAGDPRPTS